MSAKDTLKKIADALGVTSEAPASTEPVVEASVEQKEETPIVEKQIEEPAEIKETVEEPLIADAKEEVATENASLEEDNNEEVKEPVINEPSELDILKDQISELKNLIAEQNKVPEVEEEPKGLVHNPEAGVQSKGRRIGNKGGDITSRVYKYINS